MSKASSSSFLSKAARKTSLVRSAHGSANASSAPGITLLGSASALPWRQRLAQRSRVTNLGILLLMALTSLSVVLNIKHWAFSSDPLGRTPARWDTFFSSTPKALQITLPEPIKGTDKLNHLVLVVGHAIWAGTNFAGRMSDDNWVLEQYQRGGSVKTFWKHIERGIQIANKDKRALLVFSGGQTRSQSLQTEAESYFSLALSSGMDLPVLPGSSFTLKTIGDHEAIVKSFFDDDKDGAGHIDVNAIGSGAIQNEAIAAAPGLEQIRMTTETFALDSYENLLFSVARFREYTGAFPERITVVGFGMKKERFENLHAKAIRWPSRSYVLGHKRFAYIGIDDEGDKIEKYKHEQQDGYKLFERDMYGCHGELLAKRKSRNPARRFHPYFSSAPEIAGLLNWCPPDGVGLQGTYPKSLPWDPRVTDDALMAMRTKHPSYTRGGGWLPDIRWLQFERERD
ncbi:hypothetical protein K437DRAFT_256721 [Tilletiaria anomala UBC 951]|uniref:Uncharacterized protein n=1 Tax=Tilletiaria anomala (strain ATCC 24038 / CBS 436.72 / UBC 951) TaxID=1037660 RepID=A0A066VU92_TILAU|nr:uncharacterized protein K437DRAFT_256721 [Tilletiaria anomala UBC 951]KDN45066.1 hypothetical protein K437DRAFT_256721 [Tilletiaria anomala UBC 951]